MKVLIVGRGNPENVARMLRYYKVDTISTSKFKRIFEKDIDVSIIFGAWSFKRIIRGMMLPGKKIFRIQGTDAYRMKKITHIFLSIAQKMGASILYADENLKKLIGLHGKVWITPIDTQLFKPIENIERTTDILYYCREGQEDIYKLNDFKNYIPTGNTYTIINGEIPIEDMPIIYSKHKKYIRFTLHDAHPKMPYEAFICGCEVWMNGNQITEIPEYMLMEHAIPKLISYLGKTIDNPQRYKKCHK